jgi:sensor histidine kinase YesM
LFLICFWVYNQGYLQGSIFSAYEYPITIVLFYLFLALIPLAIVALLSYAYSAIFLGKKVAYQFLEFFVNFIFISLLNIIIATSGRVSDTLLLTLFSVIFYINTFYVTPLLIKKQQKTKYWFLILFMVVLYFLSVYLIVRYDTGSIFSIFSVFVLIYALSFVYGYVRIKIISKEKLFTLKLGAKDSELQLLKSQVNPHFLFNTLNTLYSTALEEKAEKTAQSTAKLASLIRYMQEDINKDFIPLQNEIKYLNDYINIQELRCAVKPNIETEFVNIKNHNISPGLLIPFVENAFKYGIDPSKPSSLKVSVVCNENTINFECVNSYKTDFKTYYKEQGFGIGIKNAKQRLELIYPKKHTFSISKQEELFSVNMSINTK